ncbi:MAG: hypothetical protein IPK35_22965 [Saprospiraceae bacterium]|nr:hypothetical protein [Saprospiraceae bacterium]MBK8055203.1 hypothetical protein [Saprospiraceae bacterium]MBK8055410.1 hypothetical protein [Saprospiraceae bacterium]MBK8056050.1 hypothetical protein [Saprospiraceae bacterium]
MVEVKEELRLTKEELRLTKEDNEKLKARIIELSHKKNSSNSSLPPQRIYKEQQKVSDKKVARKQEAKLVTKELH